MNEKQTPGKKHGKQGKLRSLTVRLTEEMAAKLEAAAGDEPIAVIVREAIREHFDRQEATSANRRAAK